MARDKNKLYITVPSLFRCPISMDVMKSPVSLCTGVTYDRSSITTWLDSGHNTCPATMQVLHSTDFVPNLTLRRLIRCWSDSLLILPDSPASASHPSRMTFTTVSKHQVLYSMKKVIERKPDVYSNSLSQIVKFGKYSDENREFISNYNGFVSAMVDILNDVVDIEVMELIIAVLDLIISESRVKEQLHELMLKSNRDCLSPFVLILQKGKLNSKINSAKVLESIATNEESKRAIADKQGLVSELYNLVSSETDRNAIEAGISALIAVSSSRTVKKELIGFGIVRTGAKILSGSESTAPIVEKVVKLLEMMSTCTEGRTAICEDETCVAAIVQKLMKALGAATEHGIGVIHSVCYLARDQTAQEAVMKGNGLTKVLLVMQSNCSGRVRQMCGDLVKVFRVNSKSCLASYETRTTHISPY